MDSAAIYKTYAPLLYGTILSLTSDKPIADLILERSFVRILIAVQEPSQMECRLFTRMMRITLAECASTLHLSGSMIILRLMPYLKVPPSSIR